MRWSPPSIRRKGVAAVSAPADVAGGTGDIAFRVVDAGGAETRATVMDINAEMLEAGRERAAASGRATG